MLGVGGAGGLGGGSPAGLRIASPNWMTAHTLMAWFHPKACAEIAGW